MEEQRQRAKAAAVSIDLTLQDAIDQVVADQAATCFEGYEVLDHASCVQALVVNGEPASTAKAGDAVQVCLTPRRSMEKAAVRWAIAGCWRAVI